MMRNWAVVRGFMAGARTAYRLQIALWRKLDDEKVHSSSR